MQDLVFLIDLDNTLLDNDGVKRDIESSMLDLLGPQIAARFWELYEEVRKDIDVIDFYETMRRLREEFPAAAARVDAGLRALMDWDFRPRLFPRAIDTVRHLASIGLPIVVSDGDPVFQPMKIHQCGVTEAVAGRVLIFVHKEKYIPALVAKFESKQYVLIDDKPGILMRSKKQLGDRLTTVHVLQGKYALDPKLAVDYTPDIVIEHIAELIDCSAADFMLKARATAQA